MGRQIDALERRIHGLTLAVEKGARAAPPAADGPWRKWVEERLAALEGSQALRDAIASMIFADQVSAGGEGNAPAAFAAADRFLAEKARRDYRSPIRTCDHLGSFFEERTKEYHCALCGARFSKPNTGLDSGDRFRRELEEQAEEDERRHRAGGPGGEG